ncbi:PIG-L family deacetylase [Micromonospora zamorensis]|uniref:PIG-L family deacetylase n=1 Tax=Micromonospora zamorensis TaxID=709883 RepID=UPI0036911BC6
MSPARQLTHLQILAHTDDDLYFMVPDLLQTLRAGTAVVCVYLTAGEADGRNVPTSDRNRLDYPQDFEGYTTGRQSGLRAAYSAIVTGRRDAVWKRTTLDVRDGVVAEVNTFEEGCSPVTLIFLNLRMGPGDARVRLRTLWTGDSEAQETLRPTDSPIPGASGSYRFTREGLLTTLVDLLEAYQPSVVRVMDPDPDHTKYGDGPTHYCDNEDHTAAALFAMEALRRYDVAGHPQRVTTESYRGYWNKLWPFNLSGAAFAEKVKYLSIYGGEDGHKCDQPLLCGDRQLGNRSYNRGYGQSTTYRYHGSTSWLRRMRDGRLAAFGVLDGRPARWLESAAGSGTWTGPESFGGSAGADEEAFLPLLEVVRDTDGRLHAFGIRATFSANIYGHVRDVVLASETDRQGEFADWENLGNPYNGSGPNPIKRREIGSPAAVVDGKGRLRFFVRNFGSGMSARVRELDGTWGPWLDHGGRSQDGYHAIRTCRGTIELYGGSVGDGVQPGIVRWSQQNAEGAIEPAYNTLLPAPAGPPTVVELPDGRLLLLVRQPNTAWVVAYRQERPGGRWDPTAHFLGGDGGIGLLAALVLNDDQGVVIAQRNDAGRISVCLQPAAGDGFHTRWVDLGGSPVLRTPAIETDATGLPTVAVVGADGRLRSIRLSAAKGVLTPHEWVTA